MAHPSLEDRRNETPTTAPRQASPSHGRPVDLVHLSHQTMGDGALEREVLGLLGRQIALFRERLLLASGEERRRIAHALKGASLNVGAFRLAQAAETLEAHPDAGLALAGFEAEMAIAGAFIAELLRGETATRLEGRGASSRRIDAAARREGDG